MVGWTELWTVVLGVTMNGDGVARIWTETCYTMTTPDGWTAWAYAITLTLQGLVIGRTRR